MKSISFCEEYEINSLNRILGKCKPILLESLQVAGQQDQRG